MPISVYFKLYHSGVYLLLTAMLQLDIVSKDFEDYDYLVKVNVYFH